MFNIIPNHSVYFFDVDNTLIEFVPDPKDNGFDIHDPYDGETIYVCPLSANIKFLKRKKAQGNFVIVWSLSGVKWVEEVVKALELTEFVDLVMTKPVGYVDDSKENPLGKRFYFTEWGT